MDIVKLLFPILAAFEEDPTELEIISMNNANLAKELEGKPPMTAKQIKQYCANRITNATH